MSDIFFSPLNQFRFVPNEIQIGNKFNTNDFDKVLFPEQILYWQENKCYLQPVQKSDGFKLIFSAQNFVNEPSVGVRSEAHLIKKGGGTIKTVPFELSTFRVGNLYYYYANYSQFFSDLEDGVYAIVLNLYYRNAISGGAIRNAYYYSDAFSVKEKHSGSLWLQYNNYYSKLGIPFEQLPSITSDMGIRVHGSRTEIGYTTERTVFDDQDNNPIQLKATANRSFSFYFGGDQNQVPDYILDKLNHIFTLSDIRIEGVPYVPSTDSVFEKEGNSVSTLYGASILLNKKDNLASYEFIPDDILVFNVIDFTDITYPFSVDRVLMRNRQNVVVNTSLQSTPFIIQNLAQRTSFIDALNNSRPIGTVGIFQLVGNVLTFTKNVQDDVYAINNPTINQKGFRINTRYVNATANSYTRFVNMPLILGSALTLSSNINAVFEPNLTRDTILSAPSVGDYYCLVFTNDTSARLQIGGIEFVSIESFGNNIAGFGNDYITELAINQPTIPSTPNSALFAQPLVKWSEGRKVNGVVLNTISLVFSFTNSYSFPSMNGLGRLGFSRFRVVSSGMSVVNIDNLFNDIYNCGLQGQLHPSLNLIEIKSTVGTASVNSLIARNYLSQVLGITIII